MFEWREFIISLVTCLHNYVVATSMCQLGYTRYILFNREQCGTSRDYIAVVKMLLFSYTGKHVKEIAFP